MLEENKQYLKEYGIAPPPTGEAGRGPTKHQIATFIALLFHVSGFIAIAIFHSQLFISLTPLNLLISCGLLIWTQERRTVGFWVFILASFIIGFVAEYIGIHTQILFGNYQYGEVLGLKWRDVPWMIGITWFGITYCCGIAMSMLQRRISQGQTEDPSGLSRFWMNISLVMDGAAIAVFYDWILEPVAIKLGFWDWNNGVIPSGNYWGWFFVSAPVLLIFRLLPFPKQNLFAVNLLLIQAMFFLLLRTFY